MIVDAVRYVYETLTDGTTGLNAVLPNVPRDGGDAAPASVTLDHAFNTAWLARGHLEREAVTTTPRVDVLPGDDVEIPSLAGDQKTGVPVKVVLRYAVRASASDDALRDAWQTLRCAIRVLSAPFNDATFADITRTTVLFDPPTFRLVPMALEEAEDLTLASLVVTYPIVDRWAMGATA